MAGYDDKYHAGNSEKYHTGKLCIEGCGRPAGTAWSPYWCFECNVIRINRISHSLGVGHSVKTKKNGGTIQIEQQLNRIDSIGPPE